MLTDFYKRESHYQIRPYKESKYIIMVKHTKYTVYEEATFSMQKRHSAL